MRNGVSRMFSVDAVVDGTGLEPLLKNQILIHGLLSLGQIAEPLKGVTVLPLDCMALGQLFHLFELQSSMGMK